jgi:methanogenic corrinoid protein MtbC1
MLDFDESRFEKVLNTAIMKMGFEEAFVNLILVFLQRIGFLWSTGAVNPSQEHFISNLIRRKLCVAIDNRYVELNEKSKRFLLFLPEGETHEILLLFSEYLLRKNNHNVVYLGSSVPFEDILFLKDQFRPDCVLLFITVPMRDLSVFEYVQKLSKLFSSTKIYIGGAQLDLAKPDMPSNFTHIRNLDDFMAILL